MKNTVVKSLLWSISKLLKHYSMFIFLCSVGITGISSAHNSYTSYLRLNTFQQQPVPDSIKNQENKIEGVVKDPDGIPLPGANVIIAGTKKGVVTNFDGYFTINAKVNDMLNVSYIGMKTLQIRVKNTDTMYLTLEADAAALNEVVVVGYGTQKKKDLTGAIVRVKAEDFTPGTNSDARQLLKGTASGVTVTQTSSAPGAGLKIRIRGAGSINSDNGVLFVVDGLPGVNPSSLSPDDIESIEVLKDASASSIYGTRAANGVVLITTKKGNRGKTTLSYNSYTGFQHIPEKISVLGAADYMRMVNFRLNVREDPSKYSDEDIAAAGNGTNWQDEIFKNAMIQNHQLSISGGNNSGNYYIGLNYFDQEGLVLGSGNQKYNTRFNVETQPTDRLKFALGLNFTREITETVYSQSTDGGLITSAIKADPTVPPTLDEQGRYLNVGSSAQDNPLALALGVESENASSRFYGTLNTDYQVVSNLTTTLRLGVESNNGRSDRYSSRLTQGGLGSGGVANIGASEYTHWLVESLLKYQNTFNQKHDFSILGGASFEEFLSRGVGANSRGFLSDVTHTDLLQSGDGDEGDNVSSSKFKNQLNGFLGRLTYGYNSKYLMTISFRVDGSSKFAQNNKYAFFPSGSLGWRISEEPFMQRATWINELKFRLGYGELGNQGINNFETRQTLVAGGNSVFGDQIAQGVVPARLPNPNLKWETTAETNVGLDYSFWNSRISGSIDYFHRKTYDQLFIKPLPAVVGFSSVRTNIGEVLNTGVDFSLTATPIDHEFKWQTGITISYLENTVTRLPDFTEQIIGGNAGNYVSGYWIVKEGAPLRSFYGYEIEGIFQEGDDIENSPTPVDQGYTAGMPRFVDQNNDGTIDAEDRTLLGDSFPDFTFGIRNTFRYKNLTLDLFINGVTGVKSFNNNVAESIYPVNTFINSISRYYFERWTPENPSNTLPSGANYSIYAGARAINSLTVVDASYVRLKNVTLAYNVPVSGSISALRLYVAGENLITITDFEGYDPEASVQGGGIDSRAYNSYPLARTIRFGMGITF